MEAANLVLFNELSHCKERPFEVLFALRHTLGSHDNEAGVVKLFCQRIVRIQILNKLRQKHSIAFWVLDQTHKVKFFGKERVEFEVVQPLVHQLL